MWFVILDTVELRKQQYNGCFKVAIYTIPTIICFFIITMMKLLVDNAQGNIIINATILTAVQILFYIISLIICNIIFS